MKVLPTGVTLVAECELQLSGCTARDEARPIMAVFPEGAGHQVNVCRACLEQMVRAGDWEVSGARVSPIADIVVYDDKQRPQVVIETKKSPTELGLDIKDWAYRVHRNLLVHHAVPPAPFFWLIATNGQFYLWKHQESLSSMALPDYSGSLAEQLSGYIYMGKDHARESERPFADAVVQWVQDIKTKGYQGQVPLWLSETGLLNVLQKGQIKTQVGT